MSIMHPPRVERDTDTIKALDWAIPCRAERRHHFSPPAADWIVYSFVPKPCGCYADEPVVALCHDCLDFYMSVESAICDDCGTTSVFRHVVARTEAI